MKITQTLFIVAILLLPSLTMAFSTFESIPFVGNESLSTQVYINAMYKLIIGASVLLAVIKLMIAGLKYMLSDLVTSQSEAKKEIKASLIGLLIVLGATTLLNTINPNITKLDVLGGASNLKVQAPADAPAVTTSATGYTEAQSAAQQCGGSYRQDSAGKWVYSCPNTGTQAPKKTQLSGWPQVFPLAQSDKAGLSGVECENKGGVYVQEVIDSIPVQYKANCYSK